MNTPVFPRYYEVEENVTINNKHGCIYKVTSQNFRKLGDYKITDFIVWLIANDGCTINSENMSCLFFFVPYGVEIKYY